MLPETVSQTALGTTAGRALESSRHAADRLFEDPFAMRFLPPPHRAIVRLLQIPVLGSALLAMRERRVPGIMGSVLCRTRYIDDAIRAALAEGLEQVVILGAGFDSRAYRIPGMARVRVFEVDHPATQAWKRNHLQSLQDGALSHVTFVPMDFERQDLGSAISEAGFRASARSFVIWEGVTQYIGAEAVDATLRWMTRAVARGSRVVFTYVHRGLIDGYVQMRGASKLLLDLKRLGEPWMFGIDPDELSQYLAARGLGLIEEIGAADYRARYLEPTGRDMHIFEGERVALAEVVGGKEATQPRLWT